MQQAQSLAGPMALMASADQDRLRTDLTAFFGPQSETYLAIYDKLRDGAARGRRYVRSWSWPVFFGGFVWFFYRKMYVLGATVVLVPILLSHLFGFVGVGAVWGTFSSMAHRFYMESALRRIAKADALGLAGEERADYLHRAGGVSRVGGGLAAVIYGGLLLIVVLALASAKRHVR
jgi:uncharacterized protein DUF2628